VVSAENNQGLACLALGDYPQAEACFLQVLELSKTSPWEMVSSIIETRDGLAEVVLFRNDLEAAWAHSKEAEQLASGRDFKMALAYNAITKAHLAQIDNQHGTPAAVYYQRARDLVHSTEITIWLARLLLEEARYQQRHGRYSMARPFAEEAWQHFKKLESAEETQITQALLTALP
jgi:tetratricopeptide (TPR) repeat protein